MKKVTIYTDGSSLGNPGPGGYGVILSYGGVRKELSGGEIMTTNNRMELTGAIAGLAALKEPCEVELYSDSRYLVDGVEKGWVYNWQRGGWKRKSEPVPNSDLWKRLLELMRTHNVRYIWVRGHADNEQNERCDELAVAYAKKLKEETAQDSSRIDI